MCLLFSSKKKLCKAVLGMLMDKNCIALYSLLLVAASPSSYRTPTPIVLMSCEMTRAWRRTAEFVVIACSSEISSLNHFLHFIPHLVNSCWAIPILWGPWCRSPRRTASDCWRCVRCTWIYDRNLLLRPILTETSNLCRIRDEGRVVEEGRWAQAARGRLNRRTAHPDRHCCTRIPTRLALLGSEPGMNNELSVFKVNSRNRFYGQQNFLRFSLSYKIRPKSNAK